MALDTDSSASSVLAGIEVEWHALLPSTQDLARERMRSGTLRPLAVIANAQSAGRGQRGRRWASPPGAALYLTLAWPTRQPLSGLGGLSLAMGLAVRATLLRLGLDVRLKWPNDVWLDGRKLAGILVEAMPAGDAVVALIGIGLNHCLPADAVATIDQPVADLASALEPLPTLEDLARTLLAELSAALCRFDAAGFAAFSEEWASADALAGLPVRITADGRAQTVGIARGVDVMGRLRLETAEGVLLVAAGAASVCRDESRTPTEGTP